MNLAAGLLISSVAWPQWATVAPPTTLDLYDLYFGDTSTGWVAGTGGVFRTTDGGVSWVRQYDQFVWVMEGISTASCWFAGTLDTLLRTTNGGTIWVKQPIDADLHLDSVGAIRDIEFIDSVHGWAAVLGWINGDLTTKIVQTVDAGVTWHLDSLSGRSLGSYFGLIEFSGRDTGFVFGNSILRTTDGGLSWDSIYTNFYGSTTDAQMPSGQVGFRIEDGPIGFNSLWKTTDGGLSWFVVKDFQQSGVTWIDFASSDTGWAVHYGGLHGMEVWYTSDGGLSWQEQDVPINFESARIFFIDANHGWIVGVEGLIIRTSNGGITSVDDSKPWGIPHASMLCQNFPNPFNPITVIRYRLASQARVRVRITDVLARTVAVIEEGVQSPGSHEVIFAAQNLPSGTYACELLAGDYREVIHMLLVR